MTKYYQAKMSTYIILALNTKILTEETAIQNFSIWKSCTESVTLVGAGGQSDPQDVNIVNKIENNNYL